MVLVQNKEGLSAQVPNESLQIHEGYSFHMDSAHLLVFRIEVEVESRKQATIICKFGAALVG